MEAARKKTAPLDDSQRDRLNKTTKEIPMKKGGKQEGKGGRVTGRGGQQRNDTEAS